MKPDLNLMVIFDAIMKERSVTAAAQQLAMTQPSVSNAISRMRHLFNDPLFIKDGRGIKATPRAEQIWQQTAAAVDQISQVVKQQQFDPTKSQRLFRIGLSDGMTALLFAPLRLLLEQTAAQVGIYAVPYTVNGDTLLNNADVDLVVDYFPHQDKQLLAEPLFDNPFVCVMSRQHKLATQELNLQNFSAAEHLLVSFTGEAWGMVDDELAKHGLARRVAMTVTGFANAAAIVSQTQLISSMPYSLVAEAIKRGDLVAKAMPFVMQPAAISIAWHCRHNQDPGLLWLINTIKQLFKQELYQTIQLPAELDVK